MTSSPSFHIVLVEPEIPQNTGSIGRCCLATQSTLHLIEPLGFDLSEKRLKRAGLDYWPHLNVQIYPSLSHFLELFADDSSRFFFFSSKVSPSLFETVFPPGAFFFFGKETAGLPSSLLEAFPQQTVRIPIFNPLVRSLNLAQAVGIATYYAISQQKINF